MIEFGDIFVIYNGRYFTRKSFFERFEMVLDSGGALCDIIDHGGDYGLEDYDDPIYGLEDYDDPEECNDVIYELDPEECNDVIDDPEPALPTEEELTGDPKTPYMDTIMMTHSNFLNFALVQTVMTRVELEKLYVDIATAKTDAEKFWLAVAAVVDHRQ